MLTYGCAQPARLDARKSLPLLETSVFFFMLTTPPPISTVHFAVPHVPRRLPRWRRRLRHQPGHGQYYKGPVQQRVRRTRERGAPVGGTGTGGAHVMREGGGGAVRARRWAVVWLENLALRTGVGNVLRGWLRLDMLIYMYTRSFVSVISKKKTQVDRPRHKPSFFVVASRASSRAVARARLCVCVFRCHPWDRRSRTC